MPVKRVAANGKSAVADATENSASPRGKTDGANWADTHGCGETGAIFGLGGPVAGLLKTLGTLALIGTTPFIALYYYIITTQFDGSMSAFYNLYKEQGFGAIRDLWQWPTQEAAQYVAAFGLIQAALQLLVPGKPYHAPITPKGNKPVYKGNGVQCYLITIALLFAGWHYGVVSPGRVYDIFGHILSTLNLLALTLCFFLMIKGYVAPSSSDSGSTGNIVLDFYWGTELHPRFGKYFDVKQWTNCRMGMMGWAVLVFCFAIKQYESVGFVTNSMAVSVILQQVYIFKFFYWETGYFASMDIQHDRAGYMICWGCLVWVPGIYASPCQYLAGHPHQYSTAVWVANLAAGLLCIWINYDADRQRQVFRSKGGKVKIWGKPARKIEAQYIAGDSGELKSSLLLASGWWGVSRHFHYLPEISAAFFWTSPSGFQHLLPYFYVIFLTILLTDRSFRDDARCRAKYNKYWDKYCKMVPYKMVPGIL